MANWQSKRTAILLATWYLAGWATTTLATRLVFGAHVEHSADPTQPSRTFAPLGLPVVVHEVIFFACLFAGWPVFVWPRIVRRVPIWEAGWGGYLRWLAIGFPACLVIALVLLIVFSPKEGSNEFGGGIIIAGMMAIVAMSFVAIWVLPRLLIPWLWPGAFAAPDGDVRESATDVPADSGD